MGELEVCVSCALSLFLSLPFFHRGGGGSVRVCAPCVFAREFVYARVRAELLKADSLFSTSNSDVGRSAHRAFMWRNGYSASPQITS